MNIQEKTVESPEISVPSANKALQKMMFLYNSYLKM